MNFTLKVFYTDNQFTPAVFFCSWDCAWRMWFTLTTSMKNGESGPHVLRVEIWDGGAQLDPKRGAYPDQIQQQYRISL